MLHAVGMSEPIHLADARAQRPDVSWASLKPERAERVRPLTDGLGVRGLGINLFTLQPGHAGRIHRHRRQEEIYVVLQGRLTVTVEGQSYFADAEEVVPSLPPSAGRSRTTGLACASSLPSAWSANTAAVMPRPSAAGRT
jgi:gentisate 1,2-dioxygenase